jgi:hypothetical protein
MIRKLSCIVFIWNICIVSIFASQNFNFDSPAEIAGWAATWDSSISRGTITLSYSSSVAYTGAGSLQITVTKSDTTADQVDIYYSNPTVVSGDSVWSLMTRTSAGTIAPPWFYTKAFTQDNGWAWSDTGTSANQSSSWFMVQNIRSPLGTLPYKRCGVQISLGTSTGAWTFNLDSARISAPTMSSTTTNRIRFQGKDYYIFGANLAWLQGSYQHDFGHSHEYPGWGVWYSDSGNRTLTDNYLYDLNTMGCHVIRVWLHESLEGLLFNGESTLSTVTGVEPTMWTNLDYFMSRVSTRHLYVYWSAFPFPDLTITTTHFYQTHLSILTSAAGRQAYINNALLPFINRYKNHPSLFGIDLGNEPEASVAGSTGNWSANGVSWTVMTTFLRACRDAIKSVDSTILVSCGSGWHGYQNIQNSAISVYGGLGLDFYDYHDYDDTPSVPTYASLNLDKPCIIGEYGQNSGTWNDTIQNSADSTYIYTAWNNGFAGTLVWQYNYPGSAEEHTLINSDASWRPVCYTLRNFEALHHAEMNIDLVPVELSRFEASITSD